MTAINRQAVMILNVVTSTDAMYDQVKTTTEALLTLAEIYDIPDELLYTEAHRDYFDQLRFRLRYSPFTVGMTAQLPLFALQYNGVQYRLVNSKIVDNRKWIDFTGINDGVGTML